MFLTNTQVSRLRKAFANSSSANIKLSKTQLHKIGQSGVFLGRLLVGNVLKRLVKTVLKPLGLTAAASAIDTAFHKKSFGSILIIPNEEMNNFIKIVKSLEKSGLLIKGVSEEIKNEHKISWNVITHFRC